MKLNLTLTCMASVALIAWCALTPAHAELGGAPSWQGARAKTDNRTLAASGVNDAGWTVSTSTLDSGAIVREYIGRDGKVFAVAWSGRRLPPLDQLLGRYFPDYEAGLAKAQAARGGGHGPLAVQQTGLVVETGGHMGSLIGRAWLPQALPAGVTTDQIH